ncbi:hypothetical protein BGZ89_004975, partial [Linnemannia elongata]
MTRDPPNLQAVRPISKSSADSLIPSTPAPTVYIDCQQDPVTQKNVILWDDVRLAFADALHIRHNTRIIPFIKGIDLLPLKPFRILAIPNEILDIVIDTPQARTERGIQQAGPHVTTHGASQDFAKDAPMQETTPRDEVTNKHGTTTSAPTTPNNKKPRRNP